MNRKEFNMLCAQLEQRLNEMEEVTFDIEEEINKLAGYKPVRASYSAVKAMMLLKQGKAEEVIKQYEDVVSKEVDFEGNSKLWKMLIEAYFMTGKEFQGKLNNYMHSRMINSKECEKTDTILQTLKQNFIDGNESKEILKELEKEYRCTGNVATALCVSMYMEKICGISDVDWDAYNDIGNIFYLKERIENKETVIIIGNEEDNSDYDMMSYMLHKMGVPVYMICDVVNIEENFDIEASVNVSIDNMQQFEDCCVIPALSKDGKEDNIPYIIDYICKNYIKKDLAMVIASNTRIEELRYHPYISKRFERLSEYLATYMEDKIGFAWAGDYYSYISNIYMHNVREWVDREPEVQYSIVIPVRNATETLYHTLRTCLNMNYDGNYEIVLSDNSEPNNTVAYETYKKLDSDIIKYYKAPRELGLVKSFEYAFLQTKGRYIIAIGADDGILPWTFSILDKAWGDGCRTCDVLRWDRGFYAWPGFNGKQENQFDISSFCSKTNIGVNIEKTDVYANTLKKIPQAMYAMPNLYINSGFKRSYMKKLYEKTGRLWCGLAQDIYMGVQTIALEDKIVHIQYPLTIAGMSNASIGALNNWNSVNSTNKEELKKIPGSKEYSCIIPCSRANEFPLIGTDVCGIYMCIEHLIAKGIMPSNFYKNNEEIRKKYLNIYQTVSIGSDKCEKNIYEGEKYIKTEEKSIAEWYSNVIIPNLDKMVYCNCDEIDNVEKYKEGYKKNGGLVLDASRFGVRNIYDAVQLFVDFFEASEQ